MVSVQCRNLENFREDATLVTVQRNTEWDSLKYSSEVNVHEE